MEKKKGEVKKKEDNKKFVEPELVKHEEKLDDLTKGAPPIVSPPHTYG